MLSPTQRFSDRVDDYVRSRPSYPLAAINLLVQIVGLSTESTIADVGCGTGIFATQLMATGAKVVGVEPNDPMREACIQLLSSSPQFEATKGTAEKTGLADQSADLITAAQAFHWFSPFETRQEFRRVLKPSGWVGLIWNERKSAGSSFLEEYEQVLTEFASEYAHVSHRNNSDESILSWFGHPDAQVHHFENPTELNLSNFLGRAYSSSYVPAEGTDARSKITKELMSLFERYHTNDYVTMTHETKLFLGHLGDA
jgi:SAM-dependent methyltransferase